MTRAMYDGGAVDTRPVGSCEQRAGQALDLQRSRRLGAKALRKTVRREHEERNEEEKGDCGEGGEPAQRKYPSTHTPDEDCRGWNEHHRVDLGCKRCAEERERGDIAAGEK